MSSHRLRAYIYLILTAAIWGAAGPIIKYTLSGIDPLPFLTYRFTIAAIFSLGFFLLKIKRGKKFRKLRANFPIAVFYGLLAVPIALGILFFGLDNSTVLDLTLIGIIGPLMVTAGGSIFFRDRITRREKAGISIVLLGVLLNSFSPLFRSGSDVRLTGNILLLLFLSADSGSILVAKKKKPKKKKKTKKKKKKFFFFFFFLQTAAQFLLQKKQSRKKLYRQILQTWLLLLEPLP